MPTLVYLAGWASAHVWLTKSSRANYPTEVEVEVEDRTINVIKSFFQVFLFLTDSGNMINPALT